MPVQLFGFSGLGTKISPDPAPTPEASGGVEDYKGYKVVVSRSEQSSAGGGFTLYVITAPDGTKSPDSIIGGFTTREAVIAAIERHIKTGSFYGPAKDELNPPPIKESGEAPEQTITPPVVEKETTEDPVTDESGKAAGKKEFNMILWGGAALAALLLLRK